MITYTEDRSVVEWKGYIYAVSMFLVAVVTSIIMHQYWQIVFVVGMRIRTAIIGMIYAKVYIVIVCANYLYTVIRMRGSRKYPWIPTPRMVIRNSEGGKWSQKPKFLKESVKLNWNFQGVGVGVVGSNQKTSVGVGYFLEPHNYKVHTRILQLNT